MPRNVEIKARIGQLENTLQRAATLTDRPVEIIQQQDIFFQVKSGRFKLRIFSPTRGQLIFYQRDDTAGPKTSTYQIVETDRPAEMRALLASAYGEKIIVTKTRHLFFVGRTRIHIDIVEDLGEFLELEVVLKDGENPKAGEREARELMAKLGVSTDDLIEGAYADLLQRAK